MRRKLKVAPTRSGDASKRMASTTTYDDHTHGGGLWRSAHRLFQHRQELRLACRARVGGGGVVEGGVVGDGGEAGFGDAHGAQAGGQAEAGGERGEPVGEGGVVGQAKGSAQGAVLLHG